MGSVNLFPDINFIKEGVDKDFYKENLQIRTYGRRVIRDQTVIEYLLEFLLVFIGESNKTKYFDKINHFYINGKMFKFIDYSFDSKIALKRFLFLENSKHDNRFEIDEIANEKLKKELLKCIEDTEIKKDEVIKIIQNLLFGFSAVTKNRGWFAKSTFPICEELIFCEAMGKKSVRQNYNYFIDNSKINPKVDSGFEFNEHNFYARGGEVYYLHLLQGFEKIEKEEGVDIRNQYVFSIQNNLLKLFNSFPAISKVSQLILNVWKKYLINNTDNYKKYENIVSLSCKWIRDEYQNRAVYTVKELENFLRNDLDLFEKYEILSCGMSMQILRMMTEHAFNMSNQNVSNKLIWLMHFNSNLEYDIKIKLLAVENYKKIEEYMMNALTQFLSENEDATTTLKKSYEDSHKLLRKLGKDIGLVIPLRGDNMRMTLSDNLIKFLVLSLLQPGQKITYNSFLEQLYEHFGIVIREDEFLLSRTESSLIDVSYLNYNYLSFQNILKKNGFLRELSDAISIVLNPYEEV